MKSFLHSGDAGDAIYAMPAIRDLGGGIVYLASKPWTKQITDDNFASWKALFESQPYVKEVRWHNGETIDVDFSTFRKAMIGGLSLAEIQARYVGADPKGSHRQWLTVDAKKNGLIVIHRSARYQSDSFPWDSIVEKFWNRIVMIGHPDEHRAFCDLFGQVRYQPTENHLEAAKLIAGSDLFIGNQSSPYAVAEGLKHTTVQETCPWVQDCMFHRPNAVYGKGEELRFIDPRTQKEMVLKAKLKYFSVLNAANSLSCGLKKIYFERTKMICGTWNGVYATSSRQEYNTLRSHSHLGIEEIREDEYNKRRVA